MMEAVEEEKPATAEGSGLPEPVRLKVEPPAKIARLQVLIRLALLVAFAVVGFSSLYWALYLALPPLVALAITQRGGDRYLTEEGPRLRRALAWLAGAYGYLWLLTDTLPSTDFATASEYCASDTAFCSEPDRRNVSSMTDMNSMSSASRFPTPFNDFARLTAPALPYSFPRQPDAILPV